MYVCFFQVSLQSCTIYQFSSDRTAIVVYFFLPETRRRSLEDMDLIFSQATGPLDVVRVGKTLPMPKTLDVDANAIDGKQNVRTTEHVS